MSTTLLQPAKMAAQRQASPPSDEARALATEIREHHRSVNASKAALLDCIARFDEADLAEGFGALSTASWLARELNYATTTAYEYVHVGRALHRYPQLHAAFRDGDIDYTTVRFLQKYLTKENEVQLVELAKALTRAELEQALAGTERPEDKDPDMPFFRTYTRDDGMVKGEFLLPAVTGAELLAALKIAELAASGQLRSGEEEAGNAQQSGGSDVPAVAEVFAAADGTDDADNAEDVGAAVDADAAEEACPATMVSGPTRPHKLTMDAILRLPSRYGPPLPATMYDAFVTMIDMVRTTPTSPLRAPGTNVSIICTEDGRTWMPSNPQAPSKVIRGYVANANCRGHLLDSRGLTLHVGRQQRLATDGQVAALLAVWGHQCAMPGCTNTRFIEIHHIHEWSEGGETNISNLIPLCSACHSKINHGLAHISVIGGEIEFRFLDGSRYVTENRVLPKRATDFEGPLLGYTDWDDLYFG